MSSFTRTTVTAAVIFSVFCVPAAPWGPKTTLAIVTTASHVVSRQARVALTDLRDDIINGAGVSSSVVERLCPEYGESPDRGIESQMQLLGAVRGERIAPYFAYRLGVLGKMVADMSAPMAECEATYRDLYFADVEKRIDKTTLKLQKVGTVDPETYLPHVMRQARMRDDVYEKDYQEGFGFEGVAGTSLSDDASRSVTAVANIWYTLLTNTALQADVSSEAIQDYVVGAMKYYIQQGKEGYIEGTYDRLMELAPETPELHERLGDVFYEAGHYKRAMDEYQAVLAMAPGRKEVAGKIADYYVKVGDDALDKNNFEDAVDAYAAALDASPLHPAAEEKRLEAKRLLEQREKQHEAAKEAIALAQRLWESARDEIGDKQYARAISLLREAEQEFEQVPPQFREEYTIAQNNLKVLSGEIKEYRKQLLESSQRLSGAGFMLGIRGIAADAGDEIDEEAFRELVGKSFEDALEKLRRDLLSEMKISVD